MEAQREKETHQAKGKWEEGDKHEISGH
jgi:hypothetical protein